MNFYCRSNSTKGERWEKVEIGRKKSGLQRIDEHLKKEVFFTRDSEWFLIPVLMNHSTFWPLFKIPLYLVRSLLSVSLLSLHCSSRVSPNTSKKYLPLCFYYTFPTVCVGATHSFASSSTASLLLIGRERVGIPRFEGFGYNQEGELCITVCVKFEFFLLSGVMMWCLYSD